MKTGAEHQGVLRRPSASESFLIAKSQLNGDRDENHRCAPGGRAASRRWSIHEGRHAPEPGEGEEVLLEP